MRIIHGLEQADAKRGVLTIGNFDGVHRGHQAILAAGRRCADEVDTEMIVMTFDPHPLSVLTPERMPAILTPMPAKYELLRAAGVDVAIIVNPTPAFLNSTPDDFIREVVVERFSPAAMVEGASFHFGQHRKGNVQTLKDAGKRHNFPVEIVEPVRIALGGHPDAVISSSLTRQLLDLGMMDQAALCLGRPYRLFGTVCTGAGRGKDLGYPTANLEVADQLVPAEGVYAGRSEIDGQTHPAAISIGTCPTFNGNEVIIEAHLLDFDGDLYDRAIWIDLLAWLRPQVRFDSKEELIVAMNDDAVRVRQVCDDSPM